MVPMIEFASFDNVKSKLTVEPSTSSESYESDSDSGTSSSDDYSSSSPSLSDREERFQMNQNLDV
ncbi:hypothetical protein ANCCEY_04941 [Ancylostoma ceylanicum]|uniref:Uncharacterized protein n=1 Tax=Ancylostoma ceylanicum TaxID=53326 RepID=A0A0D6M0V0_9BILA|nr:hypothetical protein ANCCEY_04941 [Ancylostoma ceylanicum]